jgi:WG repeat protein
MKGSTAFTAGAGGEMTGFAAALLCALALADAPSAVPAPLFPVVKDGKWGYVDQTGKLVVAPRFEAAGRFSEGLAPVRLGGRLGYADATGALVLVPELEPADGALHRRFSGGRAVVRKGARYGYIDRTGKLVVPARWLTAEDFSEGRALVCDEAGCGFLDAEGRYALVPDAMGGTSFKNGVASVYLAMAMSHKRTAFVTAQGGRIPGQFEDSGNFSEGLAPVRFGRRWGYVDGTGKPAIPNVYEGASDFSEGLAAVTAEGGRCGYVDRTGKLVIAAQFAACHPFSDGLARVDLSEQPSEGERVAFVDKEGKLRVRGDASKPPFRAASDFSGGLAAVADGPLDLAGEGQVRMGYVDGTGRFVWPLQR